MISINVLSRKEMLEYYKDHPDQYYISILPTGGPDGGRILEDSPRSITLVFDDVLQDGPKSLHPIAEGYFDARAFTKEQAVELVKFIKSIPEGEQINIHCVQGRSRSIAVAKFILEQYSTGNSLVYNLLKENDYSE